MKKTTKTILACAFILVVSFSLLLTGCTKEVLESIEIYADFKTEYYVGESLDTTNGKLLCTNEEGKEYYVSIQKSMISSFSTDTEGEWEMIITYKGLTILYRYVVAKLPTDVVVGDLYYSANFLGSSSEYTYVYVSGINYFNIGGVNKSPENIGDYLPGDPREYTRTIENQKVVYTDTIIDDYGYATYTIFVENKNQIRLTVVGEYAEMGSVNISAIFTKVVR